MNSGFKFRYTQFVNNVNQKSPDNNIADYFELNSKTDKIKSITVEKHPEQVNCIYVHIKCSSPSPIKAQNLSALPFELVKKIYDFVPNEYIHLTYMVTFCKHYPIVPPIWSFVKEEHDIMYPAMDNTKMAEYYKNMAKLHNSQYKLYTELHNLSPLITMTSELNQYGNWIPAITIEKDILNFILRINHFEHIMYETDE